MSATDSFTYGSLHVYTCHTDSHGRITRICGGAHCRCDGQPRYRNMAMAAEELHRRVRVRMYSSGRTDYAEALAAELAEDPELLDAYAAQPRVVITHGGEGRR